MDVTPFLKLAKPPFDTMPWDDALNGNMDTIDAFIASYMSVPNYTGQWTNATLYTTGQTALDNTNSTIYQARITYTSSPLPMTFAQERATFPGYWLATSTYPVVAQSSRSVTLHLRMPRVVTSGSTV
jgi:hypothetical protein